MEATARTRPGGVNDGLERFYVEAAQVGDGERAAVE